MIPKIGDQIYVPTSLYMSHGMDDFIGGLCTVSELSKGMSGGEIVNFVRVKERPGARYNWDQHLSEKQEELKAMHGNPRGYKDPDDRPEFNRW